MIVRWLRLAWTSACGRGGGHAGQTLADTVLFLRGLKENNCGTGTLAHNRSRRVRLSPNADCVMIGEEKAKCQAAPNCGKIGRLD